MVGPPPARIVGKSGASSYQLRQRDGKIVDEHVTKLKKCVWEPPGELVIKLSLPPDLPVDADAETSDEDGDQLLDVSE